MTDVVEKCKEYMRRGYSLRQAYDIVKGVIKETDITTDERIAQQRERNQHMIDHLHDGCIVKGVSGHINIKCPQCGKQGFTKNIDFIGARTIFLDCPCDKQPILDDNTDKIDWNDYTWL